MEIHELIEKLPESYQTKVGRRGERLSGGQKQIIALGRVFLWDPLILVLDEATSSLDSSTETTLKKALKVMLKNRTGIIIAHRFVLLEDKKRQCRCCLSIYPPFLFVDIRTLLYQRFTNIGVSYCTNFTNNPASVPAIKGKGRLTSTCTKVNLPPNTAA